jgi:hypothetical protein
MIPANATVSDVVSAILPSHFDQPEQTFARQALHCVASGLEKIDEEEIKAAFATPEAFHAALIRTAAGKALSEEIKRDPSGILFASIFHDIKSSMKLNS